MKPNLLSILIPKDPQNTHGIAPKSGIVARPLENEDTQVIDFEGNLYGASNLNHYLERIYQAASRSTERYPTVARMALPQNELEETFLVAGTLNMEVAKEGLQNRKYTGKLLTQCIEEAITWHPKTAKAINTWADAPIFPQKTLQIHALKIAISTNPCDQNPLQNLLEALTRERKIEGFQILQTPEIVEVPHGTPNSEIWEIPTQNELLQEKTRADHAAQAEKAFEAHLEEEGEEIIDTDGWERRGTEHSRTYYVKDEENPEGPSLRRRFSFTPEIVHPHG